MECLMFLTGLLGIAVIVLIRLIANLVEDNIKLKKENEALKYDLELVNMCSSNKDIIFDKEGGFKVIDKNERSETMSVQ